MKELKALQLSHAKLESQLEGKDDEILKLRSNEKYHAEKMATVGKIYNEKVKKLMTSLELSKKETYKLKDLNKENRRSELIQSL